MNAAAASPLVAVALRGGASWWAEVCRLWDEGAAVLPIDTSAPPPVVEGLLAALRPTALLTADGLQRRADGEPVAAGTAVVIATSGSTGAPKGVELSHAALEASARASLARLGAGAGDRWLCCLPLHHIAGLQVLVRSRVLGNAPVIHARFDVAAIAARRDVTMISVVPTMLRRLLDAGVDLSHLRCILLGGAAPPAQLLADAAAAGWPVVTSYGMTETTGGCVYDGRPLDAVEVDVDSDGHVLLRGPVLFSGYRRQPSLTAAVLRDGWLRTEDLGRWDGQRLEVLGRADDMIISGGNNVAAERVAGLLEEHPAVAEAAVLGRADPQWGERIVAYVVPRSAAPTLQELQAFVADRLSAYAVPRELVVVAALPRLSNGKIDRLALATAG